MNGQSWYLRLYHWFWHDVLKLQTPISVILANSIHEHLVWWAIIGSVVLSLVWTLLIHLVDVMAHR